MLWRQLPCTELLELLRHAVVIKYFSLRDGYSSRLVPIEVLADMHPEKNVNLAGPSSSVSFESSTTAGPGGLVGHRSENLLTWSSSTYMHQ